MFTELSLSFSKL